MKVQARTRYSIMAFVAVTAVAVTTAAPAAAMDLGEMFSGEQAVDAAFSAEKSIGETSIPLATNGYGEESTASTDGVDLTLPADTKTPVLIETSETTIEFTLPSSESAAEAEIAEPGSVSYDNGDGSYTVPIAGDAGDLQINTVITSPDSPTKYEYSFDFPVGFKT